MNNAKKVREMERIYFNESKENEMNKAELSEMQKRYEELSVLCRDLVDIYDSKENLENSIIKIKYHLMLK